MNKNAVLYKSCWTFPLVSCLILLWVCKWVVCGSKPIIDCYVTRKHLGMVFPGINKKIQFSGKYGEWDVAVTWICRLHGANSIETKLSHSFTLCWSLYISICFKVKTVHFHFSSCMGLLCDTGLLSERFRTCHKVITDSTNVYCNHVSLWLVVPAWGKRMDSTASGSWEKQLYGGWTCAHYKPVFEVTVYEW
jgi:hypothetical protein